MLWIAVAIIAFLVYRNYQLEKRWRAMQYCWHCMSDFAGYHLKEEEGYNAHWLETVREHGAFMARFGVRPLSSSGIEIYEEALLDRKIEPLEQHLRYWQ